MECNICSLYDGHFSDITYSKKLLYSASAETAVDERLSRNGSGCVESWPLYDVGLSRLEICCRYRQRHPYSDLRGLSCKTNRTLQFAVAHQAYRDAFSGLFGRHHAVIVDMINESAYVMEGKLQENVTGKSRS